MEAYLPRLFEAALLCAFLYLVGFCYRSASWPKTVLKTASVVILAIGALIVQAPLWLVLALLACAAGDFYLSRGSEVEFLKGVGAFAIGHVFFIILFLTDPLSDISRITYGPQIAILSVLVIMALIMGCWLWFTAGNLRHAVMGYIVIITSMGFAAATLPWQNHQGSILLGVMFFILSDLVLSAELFILSGHGTARKLSPYTVWMFYWSAQLLITAGFVLDRLEVF